MSIRDLIQRLRRAPARPPLSALAARFPGVLFIGEERIHAGERVSIAPRAALTAVAPITIGHDSMIAAFALILTASHRHDLHPMWSQCVARPVWVGSHVWIGSGAIILPGVRIGDGAVVGAGSVVNRHVPERAIVAGNPARIIRWRSVLEGGQTPGYPGVLVVEDFLPGDQVTLPRDGDSMAESSEPNHEAGLIGYMPYVKRQQA